MKRFFGVFVMCLAISAGAATLPAPVLTVKGPNFSWVPKSSNTQYSEVSISGRYGVSVAKVFPPQFSYEVGSCNSFEMTRTYGVAIVDTAGNRSPTVSATVSCDRQAPSVPSGLVFTQVDSSSIGLKWNASSDNIGVTGYDVYRNGQKVSSQAGTSIIFTGLTPSTSYQFYVVAKDAWDNASAASATISAKTKAPAPLDTTPPEPISGFVSIYDSNYTYRSFYMAIKWNPSYDNVGVFKYHVYCAAAKDYRYPSPSEGVFVDANGSWNGVYGYKPDGFNIIRRTAWTSGLYMSDLGFIADLRCGVAQSQYNFFTKSYYAVYAIDAAGNKSKMAYTEAYAPPY